MRRLLNLELKRVVSARSTWILLVFLWLICFLFLFYSIVELQISGYLWDFQGWNVEKRNSFRITITTLPIVWISYYYGEMFYNSVEYIFLILKKSSVPSSIIYTLVSMLQKQFACIADLPIFLIFIFLNNGLTQLS